MGGVDKAAITIGDSTLLSRVVAAAATARVVVVVGPRQPLGRDVTWCLEQPRGGGPVAAIAAGLAHTQGEVVVVLAADLPWIAPAVERLLIALGQDHSADAAVIVDRVGRRNHLAAAWRRRSLNVGLTRLPSVQGAAVHTLFDEASVVEVADPGGDAADCDTWDDVEAARARCRETM